MEYKVHRGILNAAICSEEVWRRR